MIDWGFVECCCPGILLCGMLFHSSAFLYVHVGLFTSSPNVSADAGLRVGNFSGVNIKYVTLIETVVFLC